MGTLAIVVLLIGVMFQAWIYDMAQTNAMEENEKLLRALLEHHGVLIDESKEK